MFLILLEYISVLYHVFVCTCVSPKLADKFWANLVIKLGMNVLSPAVIHCYAVLCLAIDNTSMVWKFMFASTLSLSTILGWNLVCSSCFEKYTAVVVVTFDDILADCNINQIDCGFQFMFWISKSSVHISAYILPVLRLSICSLWYVLKNCSFNFQKFFCFKCCSDVILKLLKEAEAHPRL